MPRSPKAELTGRVNKTISLVKRGLNSEEISKQIIGEYGVSKRQSYRYIQQAQKAKRKLPIPDQKEAFTVKLPVGLLHRLRQYTNGTGESIGSVVSQALEAFLKRREHG